MEQPKHYVGLSESEIRESRAKNGTNVLTPPKKESWIKRYFEKFSDPLVIILLVAGALSIGISFYEYFMLGKGTSVFFEPAGIFIAILLATGLAFIFEERANKAFAILNQVNDDEPVQVIRAGNTTQVAKRDIVVGDIVIINTGVEIPADGTLLEATSLSIDESTLTGEPICRKTTNPDEFDDDATYKSCQVMRGTKVMEGHGVMEVTAVGDHTENGKVFKAAQIDDSVKTPLNEQLDGLSNLITILSYGIASAIVVLKMIVYFHWSLPSFLLLIPVGIFCYLVTKRFEHYSRKVCTAAIIIFFAVFFSMVVALQYWMMPESGMAELITYTLETLMIAVALIVVAVPEGLPMAVTLSLAYSMNRMLKTNNLVRKMHACETMGATTVICTDKTGTLTCNQMRLAEAQFYALNDADNRIEMERIIKESIAVNSTAELDLGDPQKPAVLGNPTEGALLLWLRGQGDNYISLREAAPKLAELPFTTERKYMASVVRSAVTGKKTLYVKGAPEIIADLCQDAAGHVSRETVDHQLLDYQNRAMRTLGFAYQELRDGEEAFANYKIIASRLTFLGIVAIADPVRADVPDAVKECTDAGIEIKIVTGDTPATAREIASQIGLISDSDNLSASITTGPEFAQLSDEELRQHVGSIKVIARARPMDKQRLVQALQANNEVVAVTGDGTNDAPALKAAHVGLSMGDGTSVAKEASDITIVDNSFASIGRAVMWGRSLYQNIQRFLLFQLTVNVTACLLVLAGAFMGTESPLTVTQMLWVNLIMDTFGAMALASLPPSEEVMRAKPRNRTAFILDNRMKWTIFSVGAIMFLVLTSLLYIFQHTDITCMSDFLNLHLGEQCEVTPYELTLLFSFFVWLNFWNMFNARAYATRHSVFRQRMSSGFWTIVAIIIIGQIAIVELGGSFFSVTSMLDHPSGIIDFLSIIVLTSAVIWIRELILLKHTFSK